MVSKISRQSVAIFSCLGLAIAYALPLQAGNTKQRIQYNPPQGVGAPRSSNQGATRQPDCDINWCFLAVSPSNKQEQNSSPLTISDRPTFFLNIPKMDEPKSLYFRLYAQIKADPDSNTGTELKDVLVYKTVKPISQSSGMISFSLPLEAPALETSKDYRWEFEIVSGSTNEKVTGFIQKTVLKPEIANQIGKAQPLERAEIYAKSGIWFETVATLADLQCQQPNNSELKNQWSDLLKSVKLDAISQQPIVSCKSVL